MKKILSILFCTVLIALNSFADSSSVVIDFEDVDLSEFVQSGDSDWIIDSTEASEGTKSIQSGAVYENQSSSIELTVTNVGSISFDYKVSSEAGYDFLSFYIDGVLTEQWSGDVGWRKQEYSFALDTHTFQWSYEKDDSFSVGDDCGWLDNIEGKGDVTQYTVIFAAGEHGQIVDGVVTQTVYLGESIVLPTIVSDDYWKFIGWSADTTVVSSNMTVTALYEARLFARGDGTADNPYIIKSFQNLLDINNVLDAHYRLVSDIDLLGINFTASVIGRSSDESFTGTFDGNGHKVLNIDISSDASFIGLFGYIGQGGKVLNLGVTGDVSGGDDVGGLVGDNQGTIYNCYSAVSVSGYDYVGGLVGYHSYGTISNCYSTGSVSGYYYVSGLVGYSDYGAIYNCYSVGNVSGYDYVGGLVGYRNDGTVSSSFWDNELSGVTSSAGGTGKTTLEMQTESTFTDDGWDFVDTWQMGGYPVLNWQGDYQHYALQVQDGSGSGFYQPEDVVTVEAIDLFTFLGWTVEPAIYSNSFSDIHSSTTTFTMPDTNVIIRTIFDYYSGGIGTENDPFIISTKEDLLALGQYPEHYDKYFEMTSDIDLSGTNFATAIIASESQGISFSGCFNGDGKKIIGLNIDGGSTTDYLGLFGLLGSNGKIINVDISGCNIKGRNCLGSLVANNKGTIEYCRAELIAIDGQEQIGGLVGVNDCGEICGCSSTGTVSGSDSEIGGVVGGNYGSGSINDSFSLCDVYAEHTSGGFVGYNCATLGVIENSYSMGKVTASGSRIGGFCGYNNSGSIKYCYSSGLVYSTSSTTVGGFVGMAWLGDSIVSCFWDIETSGRTTSAKGIGKTTSEMQAQSTFENAGWSFVDKWFMNGYPQLQWQAEDLDYVLTVQNGSGNGSYSLGTPVNIIATATEFVFERWLVIPAKYTNNFDDIFLEATTFTMPATNVTIAPYWLNAAGEPFESLTINDLTEIYENTNYQYSCFANYIEGGQTNVITETIWSDDSDYADVDVNGLLSLGDFPQDTYVTVIAQYGGVTSSNTFLVNNLDYNGGAGTQENPYKISTVESLLELSKNTYDYDKHFIMTDNIDISGIALTSALIACDVYNINGSGDFDGVAFSGTFDGDGYTISNLTITEGSNYEYIGLFGSLTNSAEVINLSLIDMSIVWDGGLHNAGGIAGLNSGVISNCHVKGIISGLATLRVGGICGNNNGVLFECSSYCDIYGNIDMGILCGVNSGVIEACYSQGHMSVIRKFSSGLGGICGKSSGSIKDCYTYATMDTLYDTEYAGVLCGYSSGAVENCYAVGYAYGGLGIGALVGEGANNTNSYYYRFAGPPTKNAKGLSKDEMSLAANYIGFDFAGNDADGTNSIWDVVDGYLPKLSWQSASGLLPDVIQKPETTLPGNGTEEDPYKITSKEDFLEWESNDKLNCGYFSLENSIDLAGTTFNTLIIECFGGYFNGNNHIISNMTISIPLDDCSLVERQAVFSDLTGVISNLNFCNLNLTRTSNYSYGGGLAAINSGIIENCHVTGNVSGSRYIGGLVSINYGSIIDCSTFTTNVNSYYGEYIGGLCSENMGVIRGSTSFGLVNCTGYEGGFCYKNKGTIEKSGSYCEVKSEGGSSGGFCYYNSGNIDECYATGDVSGSGWYLGGFCAKNDGCIANAYAVGLVTYGSDRVGGFCGENLGNIYNCYSTGKTLGADSLTSFVGRNDGGSQSNVYYFSPAFLQETNPTALTKNEMSIAGNYAGFDFVDNDIDGTDDVWDIVENYLPKFSWQSDSGISMDVVQGVETTLLGEGTEANPYVIADKDDFLEFATNLELFVGYYSLLADIDFSGQVFSGYIVSKSFHGNLNGNGYALKNIYINNGYSIFFNISGVVEQLGIENITITCDTIKQFDYLGSLCVYNYGTIRRCYTTGNLLSRDRFNGRVGGLCCHNNGLIQESYSGVSINSDVVSWLSVFDVVIAGLCAVNNGTIQDCYSSGCLEGNMTSSGFVAYNNGTVKNSFWDLEASTQAASNDFGTPKTTVEMQTQSTFEEAGWDFVNVWYMDGYPKLKFSGVAFYDWLNAYQIPLDQQNHAAAPAGDDIPNLLKYAIGLSPIKCCSSADVMVPVIEESNTFSIFYNKAKNRDAVSLLPKWSDSLLFPDWQTNGFEFTKTTETTSNETWRATHSVTGECGFIRLNAKIVE